MENIKLNIVYKNKDLQIVSQEVCDLRDYCFKIKSDLLSLLQPIELIFIDKTGSCDKFDWDIDSLQQFHKIRHKLLDAANDIGRIPQNIIKE